MGHNSEHFWYVGACEVFCVLLQLAGIEAEPTYVFGFYPQLVGTQYGPGFVYQTAFVKGRLYDMLSFFYNNKKGPEYRKLTKDINPLPEEINERSAIYLKHAQSEDVACPFHLPDRADLDPNDRELMVKLGCRHHINFHYIFYGDKDCVIRLYGEKAIKEACGETVEEFRKRMDALITRYPILEEAIEENKRQDHVYYCDHVLPALTPDTIDRYNCI